MQLENKILNVSVPHAADSVHSARPQLKLYIVPEKERNKYYYSEHLLRTDKKTGKTGGKMYTAKFMIKYDFLLSFV